MFFFQNGCSTRYTEIKELLLNICFRKKVSECSWKGGTVSTTKGSISRINDNRREKGETALTDKTHTDKRGRY